MKRTILIEAECLLDMDFGVLAHIYDISDQYPDVFIEELLNLPQEMWLGMIHDNPTNNPVSIFISKEHEDEADNLYEKFMRDNYEDIVHKSNLTNLILFVREALITNLYEVCIVCSSEIQRVLLVDLYAPLGSDNLSVIVRPDDMDVSDYQNLFFRYISSMQRYDKVVGKNIFLMQCITNINEDLYRSGIGIFPDNTQEECAMYSSCNNIRTIALYDYNESYFPNNGYPLRDSEEEIEEDEEEEIEEVDTSEEDDDFDPGIGIDIGSLSKEDYIYE